MIAGGLGAQAYAILGEPWGLDTSNISGLMDFTRPWLVLGLIFVAVAMLRANGNVGEARPRLAWMFGHLLGAPVRFITGLFARYSAGSSVASLDLS